jgi:hypothetical protein
LPTEKIIERSFLQESDEVRNSEAGLGDDGSQRPSRQITSVNRNGHLAGRVAEVDEMAVAA